MPRYFFDYTYDDKVTVDEEGLELPSPSETRVAALEAPGHNERVTFSHRPVQDVSTSVREETGRLVFTTSISLSMRWGHPH